MRTILATMLIALALCASALAQQTTIYGPDGRAAARSVTDTQGTTTVYDARTGRAAARASPSLNDIRENLRKRWIRGRQ